MKTHKAVNECLLQAGTVVEDGKRKTVSMLAKHGMYPTMNHPYHVPVESSCSSSIT